MKDIKIEKCINYIKLIVKQRDRLDNNGDWMKKIQYSNEINNILLMLYLTGAIDYSEYNSIQKKYKTRSKDLRKQIYVGDLLTEIIE